MRRELSWISHFCNKDENCYMCEVDEEWIRDSFNLYGLDNECPHYKQALNRILDSDMSSSDSSSGRCFRSDFIKEEEVNANEIEEAAIFLYGLIHARYILTLDGLEEMVRLTSIFDF